MFKGCSTGCLKCQSLTKCSECDSTNKFLSLMSKDLVECQKTCPRGFKISEDKKFCKKIYNNF